MDVFLIVCILTRRAWRHVDTCSDRKNVTDTCFGPSQLLWTRGAVALVEKVWAALLVQGSWLVRTVGPCAQRRVASGAWPQRRNEWREVLFILRCLEPQAFFSAKLEQVTKPQAKREPRTVLVSSQYSSPVHSIFEQSENVAIAHEEFEQPLLDA
jgi:hypothetical protein